PAEVGGVVAEDHALGALDHADAQHHAAANVVVGLVAGQRADLHERAVPVEQQRDAFPDEQLAAAPVALDRPLPAPQCRLLAPAAACWGRPRMGPSRPSIPSAVARNAWPAGWMAVGRSGAGIVTRCFVDPCRRERLRGGGRGGGWGIARRRRSLWRSYWRRRQR